jgi:hypothetical protein
MDVPLTGTGISLISVIWTVKAKKKKPFRNVNNLAAAKLYTYALD